MVSLNPGLIFGFYQIFSQNLNQLLQFRLPLKQITVWLSFVIPLQKHIFKRVIGSLIQIC